MSQPTDEREMTPAEVEAMRKRMTEYYKLQNPLLELQSRYETLLADIEEARCRRITMNIRLANMVAETQPKEPKDVQTENIEKLAKKLKTEKA
jgi:endonuclease III